MKNLVSRLALLLGGLSVLCLLVLNSCEAVTTVSKVAVTGITLNKSTSSLVVGATESLTATIVPSNATNQSVNWISSAPTIATVDQNGKVTGIAAGTAVITATTADGGKTAQVTYTITAAVTYTSITLNKTTSSIAIGKTETLTATIVGSAGASTVATWTSSDPAVATVAATGTVTGVAVGTATITAATADKSKTATATITVVANVDVSADVTAGLNALASQDITKARTAFVGALAKNPTDNDAKIWSAFLEAATLAVNTDVVSVFKDNLGVVDYPSDINTLITDKWFKSLLYNYGSGFVAASAGNGSYVKGSLVSTTTAKVSYASLYNSRYSWVALPSGKKFIPDSAGSYYASYWYDGDTSTSTYGYDYLATNTGVTGYYYSYSVLDLANPQLFPTIAPVTGFIKNDATPTTGTSAGYTASDWSRLAVLNVLTRNSTGFNALVDKVTSGPLGTSLDTLITRLNSVDDTYRTTVPSSLYKNQVPAGTTLPSVISIGKPELLLFVSSLEVQKSLAQYLASADWAYPFGTALVTALKDTNAANNSGTNADGVNVSLASVLASTPGVYFSTLLKERNATSRTASKTTFLSALGDIQTALGLYKTALNDSTSYYRTSINQIMGSTTSDVTQGINALTNAQAALTKLVAAVTNNTSLYVPQTLSTNDLVGASYVWPTASSSSTITVNPGALWADNALDFRNWFEGSSTEGFTNYIVDNNYDWNGTPPSFLFKAPDFKTLTASSYGVDSSVKSGSYRHSLSASLALKVNASWLKKYYPSASPSNRNLIFQYVSWDLVASEYNNSTNKYDYIYSPLPNANVQAVAKWINKQ